MLKHILKSSIAVILMCITLHLFGVFSGLVHYDFTFQFIIVTIAYFTIGLLSDANLEMEREWIKKS